MSNVLIVGGGATGIHCARYLSENFDVTLIEKKKHFHFTPDVLSLISGSPKSAEAIPYEELLDDVQMMHAEALGISDGSILVKGKEMAFDYLVLCTGSLPRMAFDGGDALTPYEYDSIVQNLERIRSANSHVVIGGGPVGIELLGELDKLGNGPKVTIVSGKDRLLDRFGPKVSRFVQSYFKGPNIEVLLSKRVLGMADGRFFTDEGTSIEADMGYVCTGSYPNTSFLEAGLRDAMSASGHVRVNSSLQVQGHRNIFAGGDISSIYEEKTYLAAERHAVTIASNIASLDKGGRLKQYVPRRMPLLISLGRGDAFLAYNNDYLHIPLLHKAKMLERDFTLFTIKHPGLSKILFV
ncbi:MAG: FAD-dependent oxidoreductase [Candidatus Methanofastidiosa archaeon]|nr:FAD-dependent oxidoreductase [Candidatus Methanofastidiosa archaeon]